MSNLPVANLPDEITSVFKKQGTPPKLADVKNFLMAGALLDRYDGGMLYSDNTYLEEVGKNLMSSEDIGITVSTDIVARVANLSLGINLFDLDDSEQHDWVIFCDWFVAQSLIGYSRGEATLQSQLTFETNRWTESFNKAGIIGFTIVGQDICADELRYLALHNNEGISKIGESYSSLEGRLPYQAQNYRFNPT